LNSDLDILLPKMDFAGPAELFFMLAITDGIGGEAISKRIRAQFDGSEHLRQAGLTHAISYRSLDPIQRNAAESMEGFLERMTTNIHELVNKEISSRLVRNG
jgi:hypothetical protein